jgi:hypothetical protein
MQSLPSWAKESLHAQFAVQQAVEKRGTRTTVNSAFRTPNFPISITRPRAHFDKPKHHNLFPGLTHWKKCRTCPPEDETASANAGNTAPQCVWDAPATHVPMIQERRPVAALQIQSAGPAVPPVRRNGTAFRASARTDMIGLTHRSRNRRDRRAPDGRGVRGAKWDACTRSF